jgi:hypothetical protein
VLERLFLLETRLEKVLLIPLMPKQQQQDAYEMLV